MDNQTVKVNLDTPRMYRPVHEESLCLTVGPGTDIEVPLWVAQAWGLVDKPDEPPAPRQLSDDERFAYEQKIAALEAELEQCRQPANQLPGNANPPIPAIEPMPAPDTGPALLVSSERKRKH